MNLQEAIARAENGDIDAMVDVAEYIVWEENVKSDIDPELGRKVLEYLGKAIEAGNDQAMNLLGTMYYSSRVVEKDQSKAMEWYQKATEKGNALSMLNLGYGYYYGNGLEKNMEMAYKMFTKAALLGQQMYSSACLRLGRCFRDGIGTEKDLLAAEHFFAEAHYYFKVREANGDYFVEEGLKESKKALADILKKS